MTVDDLLTCFFKPVANQVSAAGYASFVGFAQRCGVGLAQFANHFAVTQKRRVAHNHIGLWPLGFLAFGGEQGIAVFDAVQGFEDRAARQGFAVALAPLDVANPDRHAGQFGGKSVDLDAQNVVWPGLHDQLGS